MNINKSIIKQKEELKKYMIFLGGNMTEKRFTLEEFGLNFIVNDNGRNLTAKQTVDRLNDLNDENERLQTQLSQFAKSNREGVKKVQSLAKENEQLKQYIYDNVDEDICDVCSYQYLEKSQMEKYYVAKCKKGYDNCSKGTVIHCKDFKFKELQE